MKMKIFLPFAIALAISLGTARCSAQKASEDTDDGKDKKEEKQDTTSEETLPVLKSSMLELSFSKDAAGGYFPDLTHDGELISLEYPQQPVVIDFGDTVITARYSAVSVTSAGSIECKADIKVPSGGALTQTDIYSLSDEGSLRLSRTITVKQAGQGQFCSRFALNEDGCSNGVKGLEFMIPGVVYKPYFTAEANIPSGLPTSEDKCFMYRADRVCLPMVMCRRPSDGRTISITHVGCVPSTLVQDSYGVKSSVSYQYGAVGFRHDGGSNVNVGFVYPGNEEDRPCGNGERFHPLKTTLKHSYTLDIRITDQEDYASAVSDAWHASIDIYDPQTRHADLDQVYDGLIETLLYYYGKDRSLGGRFDAPGWPFSVSQANGWESDGYNYEMGFVGQQVSTGYHLYRDGIAKGLKSEERYGKAVLDFWATSSQTDLGMPRCWYDPDSSTGKGTWRDWTNLRSMSTGMEALAEAWAYAIKNDGDYSKWQTSCEKYASWLLASQNPDGSWYRQYDHKVILNGKHPTVNSNKYLTICAIRFLVDMYSLTSDESYKTSAIKAGEWCYENIHAKYLYKCCCIDNPETMDAESGQKALDGFLALYELTGEQKWLDAAKQAGIYAQTMMYCYEIPVEKDRQDTDYPASCTTIGEHLIAVWQTAVDHGAVCNTYFFYKLYDLTGDALFKRMSLITMHNTKDTMNWDQSMYPGHPKALQIEAHRVMIPRRINSVMGTLNWGYASHLEPMFSFIDDYGTYDIDKIK